MTFTGPENVVGAVVFGTLESLNYFGDSYNFKLMEY